MTYLYSEQLGNHRSKHQKKLAEDRGKENEVSRAVPATTETDEKGRAKIVQIEGRNSGHPLFSKRSSASLLAHLATITFTFLMYSTAIEDRALVRGIQVTVLTLIGRWIVVLCRVMMVLMRFSTGGI